jgi:hypothetical protein
MVPEYECPVWQDDPVIQSAILRTLPKAQGERWRCVFELARALKAVPAYAEAEVNSLRPIVVEWHRRSIPFISTKPFFDTWADFATGWERVRVPAGEKLLARMFELARNEPVPSDLLEDAPDQCRLLVALVRVMQRESGDHPFFLSCRSVAPLLGVDFSSVARFLRFLVAVGILELVRQGDMKSGKASEYLYLLDRRVEKS